jgi:hypothetical protein
MACGNGLRSEGECDCIGIEVEITHSYRVSAKSDTHRKSPPLIFLVLSLKGGWHMRLRDSTWKYLSGLGHLRHGIEGRRELQAAGEGRVEEDDSTASAAAVS